MQTSKKCTSYHDGNTEKENKGAKVFFTDHIKFHEFQGKIQLTFCVLNSENEKEEGFFLCKTKGQYLNTSI